MENNLINMTKNIILSERKEMVYRRCSQELRTIYYNEIVGILKTNTIDSDCLIDYYTDLMKELEDFYNPESAYIAGGICALHSPADAFTHYINTLTSSSSYILTSNKISNLFDEISTLIGESELLLDYSNSYRECNCVLSTNISKFFNLGFYNKQQNSIVA